MPASVTRSTRFLLTGIAVLAISGVVVSLISLQHHYAKSRTTYCEIGEAFNCDIVNRSEYSSIFGVPVALIGVFGYVLLAVLATIYRKSSQTPARLLLASSAGLVFALYLTYVEARVLGVWCILCLSSLCLIAATTLASAAIWWYRKSISAR